jgi:hypothetical protein
VSVCQWMISEKQILVKTHLWRKILDLDRIGLRTKILVRVELFDPGRLGRPWLALLDEVDDLLLPLLLLGDGEVLTDDGNEHLHENNWNENGS